MKKRSCSTNILEEFDYATKIFLEKDEIEIFFTDFEKTFDKVPF